MVGLLTSWQNAVLSYHIEEIREKGACIYKLGAFKKGKTECKSTFSIFIFSSLLNL